MFSRLYLINQSIMTERCYYRISIKALIRNEDKTKFLIALEHNGDRDFL